MKPRDCLVMVTVVALSAVPLGAQVPRIAAEQIACLPRGQNGVVRASVSPEVGASSTRLYFRWNEDEDYYWVLMKGTGNGRYWGVPPKPDDKNMAVEYYVAVVDPNEQVLARSTSAVTPVEEVCDFDLDDHQRGFAENLVVGETTFDQVDKEVEGFLCDGISSRVNPLGILRGDKLCRACVVAWWQHNSFLVPAAGAVPTGAIISETGAPEASPVTPTPQNPQQQQ